MAEEFTTLSLSFPSDLASCSPEETIATERFKQLCAQISNWPQCHAQLYITSTSTTTHNNLSNLHHSGFTSSFDTRQQQQHNHHYNVTVSGPYPRVMEARGAFLRTNPLKTTLTLSVRRELVATLTDIADPESTSSTTPSLDQRPETPRASTPANNVATTSSTADNAPSISTESSSKLEATDTQPLSRFISSATSGPATPTPTLSIGVTSAPATPSPTNFGDDLSSSNSSTFTRQSLLVDISTLTRTAISVTNGRSQLRGQGGSSKTTMAFLGRDESAIVSISGTLENAETAKRMLLIAIDKLSSSPEVPIVEESVQVDLKFQNLIGGRKREWLQDLMARTRTGIYLSSPFVLTGLDGEPRDARHNSVTITGETSHVQLAKQEILRAYTQVRSKVARLSVDIANRKLDWMLQNEREKLRTIMEDNASFIVFPPLGALLPTIYVMGAYEVDVRRTIRTVMQLSCQFHSGSINVLPGTMAQNYSASFSEMCTPIAQASGAEVEYRGHAFQIFGTEFQTMEAARVLAKVDFSSGRPLFEYQFLIELPNEHREFISGKKNGKINRIMKETSVKIKFEPCNDCNFYVELRSAFADKAIEALALMQKELPAEISFYVPERYHKRIIGVGGKNIQRIMKKYGVYVKFSNAEEFAKLGGYFDNLDNVVVKTPSKNAINLDNLKQEVMGFVEDRDKDLVNHSLSIPKEEHLRLLSDHSAQLQDLMETTNSMIRFPARESGSDLVHILGPQTLIQQAIDELLSMVEEHYTYPVPHSDSMERILESTEFQLNVVDVIRRNWNIILVMPTSGTASSDKDVEKQRSGTVSALEQSLSKNEKLDVVTMESNIHRKKEQLQQLPTTPTPTSASIIKEDHIFVFKFRRNQEYHVQEAKKVLVRFLDNHQIRVFDEEEPLDQFGRVSDMALSFGGLSLGSSHEDMLNSSSSEYALFDAAPGSFATNGISGQSSLRGSPGSMMAPELRSLFPQQTATASPSLSSPRWSDQSARYGSSSSFLSSHSPSLTAPGSIPSLPTMNGVNGGSSQYSRPTSLPSDPWAPSPQQQRQASLGPIGEVRSSPLMNGSVGSPIGSQHQYGQSPSYRKSPGYSSSNGVGNSTFSPGYGPSLNSGATRVSPALQQQQHRAHQLQLQQQQQQLQLQQQQQQQREQQQSAFAGQTYPSHHAALAPGYLYPQQRQRHSSHNSAASHHTMIGLGPIGGGIDSAGGSVSSDEISTEDDSDDQHFDEMRVKQPRMHHTQSLLQGHLKQQQYLQQQQQQQTHQHQQHTHLYQHNNNSQQQYQHYQQQSSPLFGNGYEGGYGSLNGSSLDLTLPSSSLSLSSTSSSGNGRRDSAGSLRNGGGAQIQLPTPQSYYSSSTKQQQDYYGQDTSSLNGTMNRMPSSSSLLNGSSQSRQSSSSSLGYLNQGSGGVNGISLNGSMTGEDLEPSEFFSSGLGGIIGQGLSSSSHGYGSGLNGSIHHSSAASSASEVSKSRRTGNGVGISSQKSAVGPPSSLSQDSVSSGLPMASLFGNDSPRWAFH